MERTGRSSVLTVSRDFSNAIFNWTPEMIVQGQDLPIHLGSLILATKAVVVVLRRRDTAGGRDVPQRPRLGRQPHR